MASGEHEPITGVWGRSPQSGPGVEPLVRGGEPTEAESILVIGCSEFKHNYSSRCLAKMIRYPPSPTPIFSPPISAVPMTRPDWCWGHMPGG